jgi:hypothetical protein
MRNLPIPDSELPDIRSANALVVGVHQLEGVTVH